MVGDHFPIDSEGIWCEVRPGRDDPSTAPALFLDRDGVVVEEVNYLHKPEDCRLIPGAGETIAQANHLGWFVVVVTNQAGIARGYYDWAAFQAVQTEMLAQLRHHDASVDAVYACPHHEKGTGAFHHPDHPARKPNPGMLNRATKALGIQSDQSWIVGDRASDILAGKKAGLIGGLHVMTGHGAREGERCAALSEQSSAYHVMGLSSIADVATAIPAWGQV